jgi:aspartate carbamoyltransferase catalytic subunit
MNHVISARQFTPDRQAEVFAAADEMRAKRNEPTERRVLAQKHAGLVVATMFWEPSTRTRLSFESAIARLGAGIISTENAGEFSSAIKGESIEDTTKTIGRLAHVMVMRHKQTGSAEVAAAQNALPIMNGGDGKGEHPTQALLDMKTIEKEKGRLSDLTVVIGGDLANGRTARSLSLMLSQYKNNRLRFVSTPDFQMGDDIKEHLRTTNTHYEETDDMFSAFEGADTIYWTRLQRERLKLAGPVLPDLPHDCPPDIDSAVRALWPHMLQLKGELEPAREFTPSQYVINQAALQAMPGDTIIMHPLPRVDEIHPSVDDDPRAKYFDQVEYGLDVRMALLDEELSKL